MSYRTELELDIEDESLRKRRVIGWTCEIDRNRKRVIITNGAGMRRVLTATDAQIANMGDGGTLFTEYLTETIREIRRRRRALKEAREAQRLRR